MRNAIKEYISLTEAEKKELWNSAVFVFDTNIFLNLYRYTEKTRETLLGAMQQLSDRIWMPKQVAFELMKDRPKVIFDTLKIFDEIKCEKEKFVRFCVDKLRTEESDEKIKNFSKEMDMFIAAFEKESHFIEDVNNDKILIELLKLFDNKVGSGFSKEIIEEIKTEGKKRYENKIPPGYKDSSKGEQNNSFGDLIIWKEIIDFSKQNNKDIIYVTADQKDDWWYKTNGRTLGPRVELIREFLNETEQIFYMYSMDRFLLQFKEMQGNQIQQSAIDEVKTYDKILVENEIRTRYDKARDYKINKLEKEKEQLELLLDELVNEQFYLESHLNDLKQLLAEEPKDENIEDLKDFRALVDRYRSVQERMHNINKKKEATKRELEKLLWYRNRLIHSSERSEKEFDQL